MKAWFSRLFRKNERPSSKVTLREIREPRDSRLLVASINEEGGLVIEGIDRGDSVENYFGEREYEWIWTLSPEATATFHKILGQERALLSILQEKFSGEAASHLKTFLDSNQIEHEVWSRTGS